ncbi:MAG: PEP/pyruvate-binding domain-containing protein [Thermoplasmata archaeon]
MDEKTELEESIEKERTIGLKDREMDELKERVKELNCFYAISEIVNDEDLSINEALQKIVETLPPSWQHEDIACARISVNGDEFKTENYEDMEWKQQSVIEIEGEIIGTLEVCYLEERPEMDEGPFLIEERRLINAISELLGRFVEERRVREELSIKEDGVKGKIEKQDWEVIIELLMKTDPRTLLRMTRKMVYHLYRHENEKINTLLNNVCPISKDSSIPEWCGINMPNPKQDLDSLKKVQKDVFEIARESLEPREISNLFHTWLKEDNARPLLLASQKKGISLVDITDELNRFFEKADAETYLAPEDEMSIRSALIQRFFTDRLEYINVAKRYIEVKDFVPLLKNVVGPAQGTGKLGGKTSGLFLAKKILEKEMEIDDKLANIKFPKSWYLTSDGILDLIHYNDLDEVIHIKYLDPKEIRQEQPFLEQIMKNAIFTSEIVEGLKRILRDVGDKPIIVRSSSLLEDNYGAAFSGKYKSLFLSNTGDRETQLNALMDAIAEVYASTFGPDPIEYRRERGMLDFREEMGVLIQEVVGKRVGPYYMPAYAGVAFSNNEFRWSPRIKRDDGIVRLVPGLGTRAVDRVSNDYPILVSPNRPELRVNTMIEERIKYSPMFMDVINLESGAIETVNAVDVFRKYGHEYPELDKIVSVYEDDNLKQPTGIMLDPKKDDLIITFEKLFERGNFLSLMKKILNTLEREIGTPVDVEFACDGDNLYVLQCRPQSQSQVIERKPVPMDIKKNKKLFSAHKYITTGHLDNIKYIVYVKPEAYGEIESKDRMRKVARVVSELNSELPNRRFILLGPGRWGSRGDIKLGVPVKYRDINNTSLLVEIAKEKGDYLPELSFGTHFFQDLVEADIKYIPLYPDEPNNIFNEELLEIPENKLKEVVPKYEYLEDVVKVIDVEDISSGGTLSVVMDGEANEALAYLRSPDHWEWRMQMVKKMAKKMDSTLYGVKDLYLVGSTKEATAGPRSDIDLIVHFVGSQEQKDKLENWFNTWDNKLVEENRKRTGEEMDSILDVHYVTDEDIENNSSWAAHINSRYRAATKIPLDQ